MRINVKTNHLETKLQAPLGFSVLLPQVATTLNSMWLRLSTEKGKYLPVVSSITDKCGKHVVNGSTTCRGHGFAVYKARMVHCRLTPTRLAQQLGKRIRKDPPTNREPIQLTQEDDSIKRNGRPVFPLPGLHHHRSLPVPVPDRPATADAECCSADWAWEPRQKWQQQQQQQ